LRVGDPQLERAERRARPQLPPPLALRERAPAQRNLVLVPARERGRDALPRQERGDLRAYGREPAVAPGVEGRVGGEGRELGQVDAQRVVDGERALGAAD